MTNFIVSSGQTSSGLVIGLLDSLIVNGGTVLDTTVLSGSFDLVQGGGSALGTVLAGGTEFLYSGGTASDTSVGSGGQELVSGGASIDATVASAGVMTIQSGSASGATILNGGSLLDNAAALATVVGSGGSMAVLGSAGGTIIESGGTVTVDGSATGTEVQAGGTLVIFPHAYLSGTIVDSGADVISADVQIISDGHLVSFGQTLSGGMISSGVTELVFSGGTAVGADVTDFGIQYVYSGGVASLTTVGPGLDQGDAGEVYVQSGGLAVSATVQSAGYLNVAEGGRTDNTNVLQGGGAYFDGGTSEQLNDAGDVQFSGGATGLLTSIGAGGVVSVETGATVSHSSVGDGANLLVYAGAKAEGTVLSSGGNLTVNSGGFASATTVESGAVILAVSDGSFDQITVQAGGTLAVEQGVGVSGVISAAGAEVFISTGVIVVQGGTLVAASSGTLSGYQTASATIDVREGGATDDFARIGGTEFVFSGGLDSGSLFEFAAYFDYGPGEQVFGGGQIIGDTFDGGVVAVGPGGVAQDVTLSSAASYHYVDFAQLNVSSGGFATGTVMHDGNLFVSAGAVADDSFVYSGSTLEVESGGFASGTVIRTGNADVQSGGVVSGSVVSSASLEQVISGGVSTGATVSAGGAEVAQGSGGVTDVTLLAGGSLELAYFDVGGSGSAQLNQATDVLTLSGNGQTTTVQLAGDYASEQFQVSDANFFGYTGALITVEGTPCYCRGTRIATDAGEVAVEDLRIGDRLVTRSGEARSLRWIGRRCYAGRFAANNRDVLPVLFRINSLGGGLPRRDLYVSPLHAMYLDGMLIPASCLVNGETVVQVRSVDRVDYFHLELDSHDVIIAEGALSESYIDDDNRGMFHNAAEYAALYPDAPRAAPAYCAPRVEDGDALQDARRRLHGAPPPASAPLRGSLDLVERHRVAGWAMSDDGAPVRLRIVDNGAVISEVLADLPRPDVRATVGGDGRCGFSHVIEGGFAPGVPHLIQVQRASDAQDLPRSPWLLEVAACVTPAEPAALRGCLDEADRIQVQGWAQAGADPVDLQILDNGVPVGRVLANRFRADLAESDHGDGRCAFAYRFPTPLSPALRHVIDVRRASDGAPLENSPLRIEAADAFDGALEQAVAQAVASLTDQDRDRVLSFLQTQTDRLQQRIADAQAQRAERDDFRQFRRRAGPADIGRAAPARRALIIDRDVPAPGRDAGSQAILSHMRALQRAGYEVSLVAAEQMNQMAAHLTAANITHCAAPYYASVEDVLRRQTGCFDLVYLHRAECAEAYMALCRRWMPKARIVYAVADLQYLRLARQAEIEQRPELLAQSRRLRLAECTAAWRADAVLTHSPHEAALLRAAVPQANVHVVPWDVPPRRSRIGFAKRAGVAFIGNYAHSPNVDAAHFLVEEVMPLVWAGDPRIACRLVGAGMTPAIRALAGPGVSVLGQVADLGALLDTVRLTVAPLRYGAGIKGKVLDSLAAGVPCAATPIAAEGIDLPPNLIAAGEAQLAALILRLHNNQAANRAAARAGRKLVETRYNEAQVDAALRKVA